jgi:hypothetical protein
LIHSGLGPDLKEMSKHDVNELTATELLVSYSICRYLVEGRADLATRFFACAGGERIDDPIRKVLGLPLEAFEKRFLRWLVEIS